VRDSVAAGSALGVSSTPTVFVNGRMLEGAQPYEVAPKAALAVA